MTDSTDDVDWYDGPSQDYECGNCRKLQRDNKRLQAELAEARLNHKLCADMLLAAQAERAAALKDVGRLVEELAEARRHTATRPSY